MNAVVQMPDHRQINAHLSAGADFPNLARVATADLVEQIGAGSFKASYINWARTLQLLREHAPGWLPELVPSPDGVLHRAPIGAYLLLRFRHVSGAVSPEVPQAVMDARNNAIPWDKITARDVTDTHRRGACMAAAMTFGLAYELWAKMPLESGLPQTEQEPEPSFDASAWFDAIKSAVDMIELAKLGTEIKTAKGIPANAMRNLRAAYAKRAKELHA